MRDREVLSKTVRELEGTLWNTNWTETSRSFIDKFLAPKSYGREGHSLQNSLDANVSAEQGTIWVNGILNLSSAPKGLVVNLQLPACHRNMFFVY